MKVSYLVTCSTETDTLDRLLDVLFSILDKKVLDKNNEIVIIEDKDTSNPATVDIIMKMFDVYSASYYTHSLNNNYGEHKNFGIQKCRGDFIFQIDGDEMPPETLIGENLQALLESNPTVEAYAVPRINAWHGLTEEHAKQWGWPLSMSPTYNRPRAAWPDYQWRIFRNDYPRISFKKRLHERIEGYNNYVILPADENYALYHDKTIETQIATNLRYNKMFTEAENRGISDKKQ